MNSWTAWLRTRCNRLLCLLLLGLLFASATWWASQAIPIVGTIGHDEDIFLGLVHFARQTPLLGKVTFRINEDDGADFVLWMNPANRDEFDKWFGPQRGIQVKAQRSFNGQWLVTGLECAEGELNVSDLSHWRMVVLTVSLGIFWFCMRVFSALFKEYRLWYRHKPWLRIKDS